jgi:small subunit ribosomal protein S6
MRRDPRVLRLTTLKLGEKVEDVIKEPEVTVDRIDQKGILPDGLPNRPPYLGRNTRDRDLL